MTVEKLTRIVRENRLIKNRLDRVVSEGGSAFQAYVPSGGVGQVFTRGGKTYFQLSAAWATRKNCSYAWVVEI